MSGIIYKFTIMSSLRYFGHKPFYVGQFMRDVSKEQFLRNDCFVYDGSGKTWERFCKGLKRKFPTCWRKLIKREVLFYSENCSQKVLDKMEEYFIEREKSHYSYEVGGCNILRGTANNFGSGSPMKDPIIAAKVTEQLRGRRGAKRSEEGKRNMSIAAKKSWNDAEDRRIAVSKITKERMKNGGREHLSRVKKGKKFSEEHKRNIALNHADFSGSKHPLFGSKFIWINDGQKRMRFNGKENEIPNGFIKGYKL